MRLCAELRPTAQPTACCTARCRRWMIVLLAAGSVSSAVAILVFVLQVRRCLLLPCSCCCVNAGNVHNT